MMESLSQSVSSFAPWIDNQILLVTAFVGFWLIFSELVFFWLIFKYRAKDGVRAGYITGKEKGPKRFITWSHGIVVLCDIVIIVGAIWVWVGIKQNSPQADSTVRIIAQQWAWTFVHPGPDNELDTDDDIVTVDEMYIEVDKTYHFKLTSLDVLHDFSVPVFRLKQDAIPGREITGWFKAVKTGDHDIQCAEMCGIGHGIMGARLHIQSPDQHAAWVGEQTHSVALAASTE